MSGYIKYIENGRKNMSFVIKDDFVLDKYNEIWDKIKEKLNIKFHSMPVYDEKYIKVKVREFNGVIKTNFLGDKKPKENVPHACIACITIDSVMKMEKKNDLQVYSEECKYRIKKTQKVFIEVLQNSQEKTCARVFFLIKLQTLDLSFLKKRLSHRSFPVNFAKFLGTPFLTEHLWWLLLFKVCCIVMIALYN